MATGANTYWLGHRTQFYAMAESTAGTFVKPTGAGAARVETTEFAHEREYKLRDDTQAQRSYTERIAGKDRISWSVGAKLIPSGTAGTPPDLHELYKAAFGTYANSPSTSDTYTGIETQTIATASVVRYSAELMEAILGAWCNEFVLSATGGEEPKVKFSGGGMGFARTGNSTLNGAMAATDQMVVETADGQLFNAGSVVKIDTDDNSGAGYEVTAEGSRPTFTIESSISADDEDTVVPFAPTPSYAGSPASGLAGSVTWASTGLAVTGFEVTLTNNYKGLEDEAFTRFPTDAVAGRRNVSGKLTMRGRKDRFVHWANRYDNFTNRTCVVVLGSTAGKICTVTMNQCRIDFTPLQVPQAEESMVELPFTALATTSGSDDISLVFT